MKTKLNCLYCQACGIQFDFFSACKKHMYGEEHKQRIAQLFQTAPYKGAVHFPQLVIQEYLLQPKRCHPVIGLQLVTACIETASGEPPFYLCHLCQDKCPSSQIVLHLTSPDHYHAYFAYVNPGKLPFGWISTSAKVTDTYTAAELEEKHYGTGVLRVLDVPKELFKAVKQISYSRAMKEIYSTDDHWQCLKVEGLEPLTLPKYRKDSNRSYPLLGLQFMVEYCCTDSHRPSSYLCLLCQKKIHQYQAVAHVIGFDHLFWYLDRAHPLSLKTKSTYKVYSPLFRLMILDLAQQVAQSAPSEDLQVVKLDSQVFVKMETLSFSSALKNLQEIRKEQNLDELQPRVVPGGRLVCSGKKKRKGGPNVPGQNINEGNAKTPDCMDPGLAVQIAKRPKMDQALGLAQKLEGAEPADLKMPLSLSPFVTEPQRILCQLVCQNCENGIRYKSIKAYKKHVRGYEHQQCVDQSFSDPRRPFHERRQQRVPVPTLQVYGSLLDPFRKDPIIGLSLVTVCITSSSKLPVYLCHGCREVLPSQESIRHLTSTDHYFSTLELDDPEALVFGWIHSNDVLSVLRSRAGAEEKKQAESILQMLYLPEEIFMQVQLAHYSMATKKLLDVVKLQGNLKAGPTVSLPEYIHNPKRKHPLLGLQFLVDYHSTDGPSEYLCLLCRKKVRPNQTVLHLISFEHLFCYLERAHPLSLGDKNGYKHYDAEHKAMILDLATQAQNIDSPGEIREVQLDPDVYKVVSESSFADALKKLQTVWKAKNQCDLQPQMTPGQKLVPGDEKGREAISALQTTVVDVQGFGPEAMATDEEMVQCPLAAPECTLSQENTAVEPGVGFPEVSNAETNQELIQNPHRNKTEPVEGIGSVSKPIALVEVERESLTQMVFGKQESAQNSRTLLNSIQDPKMTQVETGPIGESNWSKFWFLDGRPYPSVGLEAIVECRCLKQPTFYLCLTCAEQVTSSHICDHVISRRHQYHYIKSLYPELLQSWRDDPDEVAWLVYHLDKKWDVQVVKLRPASYQRIASAPFYTAVQMIREEHDQYEPRPLISPEDDMDPKASGKTQMQSTSHDDRRGRTDCCNWQIESCDVSENKHHEMASCSFSPRLQELAERYSCDHPWSSSPAVGTPSAETLFKDSLLQASAQPQTSDSFETRKLRLPLTKC